MIPGKNLKEGVGLAETGKVLWIELCPAKSDAEVLTPVPKEVTVFGNRVFAVVTKYRRSSIRSVI